MGLIVFLCIASLLCGGIGSFAANQLYLNSDSETEYLAKLGKRNRRILVGMFIVCAAASLASLIFLL